MAPLLIALPLELWIGDRDEDDDREEWNYDMQTDKNVRIKWIFHGFHRTPIQLLVLPGVVPSDFGHSRTSLTSAFPTRSNRARASCFAAAGANGVRSMLSSRSRT